MSVWLIEHVVLSFVRGLRLPLCVVGDLGAGHSGLGIDDSHVRLTAVDVRFGGCHPVSRKVRFAVWRTNYRSCRRRRSAAASAAASATAGTSGALAGRGPPRLCRRLANQHLGSIKTTARPIATVKAWYLCLIEISFLILMGLNCFPRL